MNLKTNTHTNTHTNFPHIHFLYASHYIKSIQNKTMSEKEKKKLLSKLQPIFDSLYNVEENGIPIVTHFQTLPLRTGTDYYKIIKKPLSLHAVGRSIKKLKYSNAQEFINDLALISWNARYYNLPGSDVYRHAQLLTDFINDYAIVKLRNEKAIPNAASLTYPYLGDLPDEREQDGLVSYNSNQQSPVATANASPMPFQENSPIVRQEGYNINATPQIEAQEVAPLAAAAAGRGGAAPLTSEQLLANTTATATAAVAAALAVNGQSPASPYSRQSSFTTPKNKQAKTSNLHVETGIRRGRPPIIDKPFESRIKFILKGFKKLKDDHDRPLIKHFDRLPDSKVYTDYYLVIKNPMSLNEIRVKVRSRKYTDVDQFINDLDLMFANFQEYFQRDPYSEEFTDYQQFKKEANTIVQNELNKTDKEVLLATSSSSDGVLRYPLESLEINGYSYKIGDWVLMKNPADLEKPIVGQIFRIWSTEDGKRYCNMCWYYRPEQTCHGVDRIFFQNEVCKTGQYRDHFVDDIIGPCYVLFLTRYQKGDLPEGVIPSSAPWFICEFRYNENTHVFNRIRTWKACLPDEVREDPEQPLIPLSENRKLIKYESPIKNTLDPNLRIGDPIPDATPGTATSPPLQGSVYPTAPIPNDDLGQYTTSPNTVHLPEHDDVKNNRRAFLFTPISQLKGGGGSTNAVYATTPGLPHGTPNHEPARNIPSLNVDTSKPTRLASLTPSAVENTFNKPKPQEDKPQLPTSYKLLQEQIQENQAKKLKEQQLQQFQQQQQQKQQQEQQQQQQLQLQQQQQQALRRSNASAAVAASARGGNIINPTPNNFVPTTTNYHVSASAHSTLHTGGALAYGVDADLGDVGRLVNKRQRLNPEGVLLDDVIFYRAPPIQITGSRIITNLGVELGHSAKYLAWKLKNGK